MTKTKSMQFYMIILGWRSFAAAAETELTPLQSGLRLSCNDAHDLIWPSLSSFWITAANSA